MAERHTSNGYVNPDVKFEQTDIYPNSVVWFGVILTIGLGAVMAAAIGFGVWLARPVPLDRTNDFPAAEDRSVGLPEPPPEAIEDLDENRPRLFPDRAAEYLAPQEERLKDGDATTGAIPIDEAIRALAGKLPVAPGKGRAAPANFSRRLPSKAASGRVEIGGQ